MQGNLGGILQVHKRITGQVPGLCNLMVEKHQHPKRKILKLETMSFLLTIEEIRKTTQTNSSQCLRHVSFSKNFLFLNFARATQFHVLHEKQVSSFGHCFLPIREWSKFQSNMFTVKKQIAFTIFLNNIGTKVQQKILHHYWHFNNISLFCR